MQLRFDRGTLLVEAPPPDLAIGDLPGMLWDPRVRAFRAPGASYGPLTEALAAGGVRYSDEVGHRRTPVGRWEAPSLRSYQTAALDAWRRAGRRGTVALPTGSGKTRLAVAAMAAAERPALCLVPTRVLLEQWCRELERHYAGEVGRYGDGVRRLRAITVSTYASAERHIDRFGDRFDLLVADEVHNVTGEASATPFEASVAPFRLGLTATPPRDPSALERLERIVGPVVYELAVADLAGTYLAPFDLITLHLDLTPDERRRYESERDTFRRAFRRFCRENPGADWPAFAKAASRSADGRRALAAHAQSRRLLAYSAAKRTALAEILGRHSDARTLVFTTNNETAYAVARELLIMPITCDIKKVERHQALERFRAGALRALVSSRVLNEGLDVPDAEVAIVVGGAMGEREHVQRIGRILRPAAGKRALIYELVLRDTAEVVQLQRRRRALAAPVTARP